MKRLSKSIGLMLLLGAMPANAAEDFSGDYQISGGCPGREQPYRGTVSVRQAGVLYDLRWQIGSEEYLGTGLERDGVLSISYASDRAKGIMQVRRKGGGYDGIWSTYGSDMLCQERWVAR